MSVSGGQCTINVFQEAKTPPLRCGGKDNQSLYSGEGKGPINTVRNMKTILKEAKDNKSIACIFKIRKSFHFEVF